MPGPYTAEQAYYIECPTEMVYRALTVPEELVTWFLSKATLVPEVGGRFGFDWSQGYHMDGSILSIEPGKAVTFRWVDKLPSGETAETAAGFRVEARSGGTLLSLRHTGFTDPEHFAECSARWAYYLTNLKSVLEHGTDLRSPLDW